MKALTLIRDREVGDATLGHFQTQEGVELCVTLEEKWVDKNKDGVGDKGVSRIPAGSYRVTRHKSPSHGGAELFMINGVPGRDFILIHAGNTTADTLGCVLVGTACVPGKPAISESKKALARFMEYMKAESEFLLIVIDPPVRL